jgi:uncharacterized protein YndB with AHSA1/START domain
MNEGEVTVTAVVPMTIAAAFDRFTNEIDQWWVREKGRGNVVRFAGTQLVEGSANGVAVLAEVRAWEAPTRIELDWNGPFSQPGDSVLIEFASASGGTRVTIRHRRGGLQAADTMAAVIGLFWGDLLSRLQRP